MSAVLCGGRPIGAGHPCFIIAEAGVNHNGDIALAKHLIDVAVAARADAVKFQSFHAGRLVSPSAPKAAYQRETTDTSESQLEMLQRLELSPDAHVELQQYCRQHGICFLSTPFDEASADLLEALQVPAFKIPSGEITNLPLLAHVARKGQPMIVSTGMATLEEVDAALRAIYATGNRQVVLLQCVSAYPADPADANVRAMQTMATTFGVPVGYSDHTPGVEVALAAVALGACIIEKHVTVDRSLPGPDQRASLEPIELTRLVQGIRIVERSLGHGRKEPAATEADTAAVARKRLVAAHDIPRGATLTADVIVAQRPGVGLSPAQRAQVIGRVAKELIPAGTPLTWGMLA